jgi:hypothetical protein
MNQNFSSNLEYRQYLIHNADTIIIDNQINAFTNCSDVESFPTNNLIGSNLVSGHESEFATKIQYLKRKFIEASSAATCFNLNA